MPDYPKPDTHADDIRRKMYDPPRSGGGGVMPPRFVVYQRTPGGFYVLQDINGANDFASEAEARARMKLDMADGVIVHTEYTIVRYGNGGAGDVIAHHWARPQE